MTSQQIDAVIILLTLVGFSFCWGLLNLKAERGPLWRASIVVGIAGFGLGACMLIPTPPNLPPLHAFAPFAYVGGPSLMMVGVYLSNYFTTAPERTTSVRMASVRSLILSLTIALLLAGPLYIYMLSSNSSDHTIYYSLFSINQTMAADRTNNDRQFKALMRSRYVTDSTAKAQYVHVMSMLSALLYNINALQTENTKLRALLKKSKSPPSLPPNTILLPMPTMKNHFGYVDEETP